MRFSFYWNYYPVNQTLQNSTNLAALDRRCGRRGQGGYEAL